MSAQRAQLPALGRLAACLLAFATAFATATATALLLAPAATANPEAEANDAITAAYTASGGPTGPLGPPEGGVYPVGEGFAHNYAAGKMFFTPATGAHFMQGAILAKYEALGGPADSDLGFPTMSEGPGRVGPDSRNVTFSATDRPVIFWTPETGARVVRGAINLAWDQLGGSSGVLGVPAEDEAFRGDVVTQRFTGGELSWNRETGEFSTVPPELAAQLGEVEIPEDATSAINAARRAAGGALGPLGAKEGDQYPIGADGVGQDFVGGTIFYSPATGANVLTGQVLEKYRSVGGPDGDLGLPTSSERDGGLGPTTRMASFSAEDQPVIFWTPDHGAVIVRGAIRAAWEELGAATGELGSPVSDQTQSGDEITQRFSGGSITYNRADNTFATEPANLASQLSGVDVPGEDVPPPAAETPAAQPDGDGGTLAQWWWLLVLIPVLALVAILGALTLWRRRRRDSDDVFDRFSDDSDDDYGRYDSAPVGAGQSAAATDDEDAALFAKNYGESTAPGFGLRTAPHSDSSGWDYRGAEPAAPTTESSVPADDFESQPQLQFRPEYGLQSDVESASELDSGSQPEFESESESGLDSGDTFFDEDQDKVDTAPNPIIVNALDPDDEKSGRHAAIDIDDEPPAQGAIHLPLDDDPKRAPDGYPIKASITAGVFWSPDSADYHDAVAELWFASEDLARTNGLVKGD